MHSFIVYRTSNLITGDYYFGCHKVLTLRREPHYKGTGALITLSIKAYGGWNHHREVLCTCEKKLEALRVEHELIKQHQHDPRCLNGGRKEEKAAEFQKIIDSRGGGKAPRSEESRERTRLATKDAFAKRRSLGQGRYAKA